MVCILKTHHLPPIYRSSVFQIQIVCVTSIDRLRCIYRSLALHLQIACERSIVPCITIHIRCLFMQKPCIYIPYIIQADSIPKVLQEAFISKRGTLITFCSFQSMMSDFQHTLLSYYISLEECEAPEGTPHSRDKKGLKNRVYIGQMRNYLL